MCCKSTTAITLGVDYYAEKGDNAGYKSSNGIDTVFSNVKYKFFRTLQDLSDESSHYIIGGFLIGALSIISFLFPNLIPNSFFYIPLTFFVWGFLVFVYQATAKVRGSKIAKLLLSAIAVALTTFSYAAAKQVLNFVFEVPSTAFPITHSIISILAMPAFAVIAVSGIGFISILVIPLFFLPIDFANLKAKSLLKFEIPLMKFDEKIVFRALVRYCALIAFVMFCASIIEKINWYSEHVNWYAKRFAYYFEAEQFSYCDLKQGEKVTYLNGDLIVVASYEEKKDSYTFRVEKCVSTLQ